MEDTLLPSNHQKARRHKLENSPQSTTHSPLTVQNGRVRIPPIPQVWSTGQIEHAVVKWPLLDTFWGQVQLFINKITDSMLPLTDDVKILGKLPHRNDPLTTPRTDLVNWTFKIARSAIFKSAVSHRVHTTTILPEANFAASIESHVRSRYHPIQYQYQAQTNSAPVSRHMVHRRSICKSGTQYTHFHLLKTNQYVNK